MRYFDPILNMAAAHIRAYPVLSSIVLALAFLLIFGVKGFFIGAAALLVAVAYIAALADPDDDDDIDWFGGGDGPRPA